MKKLLLKSFLFLGLTLVSVVAWAQTAPNINYPGNVSANNYSYPATTAITAQTPTNTGGPVGAYGAVSLLGSLPGGNLPYGITTDANGNTYVVAKTSANAALATVYRITSGGTVSAVNISGVTLTNPNGIGIDGNGILYISDYQKGRIFRFTVNTATNTATLTNTIGSNSLGNIYTPYAISFDSSNNVYVADSQNASTTTGYIFKIDAATFAVSNYITGLNNPTGIAVDDAPTNAYVSSPNSTTTLTKVVGGTSKSTTAASFSTPRNITYDGLGNFYEADYVGKSIKKITSTGAIVNVITTGLTSPTQVSFDAGMTMYISDYTSGKVYKSAPTYFTYTGTIPPGLTLDPITGIITGTPTTPGSYSIAVTAASTSGNSAAVIENFTITGPTVSYTSTTPVPPYTFYQGIVLPNTIIPSSTGVKAAGGFAISPALTSLGLTFNTSTGAITGTPTVTSSSQPYTVTVTGSTGLTGFTTFNLAVVLPPAPIAISYSPAPPMVFAQNTAITNEVPTVTGLYPTSGAFKITNVSTGVTGTAGLPSGLSFDNNTGIISGTPTALAAATAYTVSVTNAGGSASVNFNLTVAAPPAFSYSTPYIATTNLAFSISPTITAGGPLTNATIAPALPAGVSINTSGVISGTATAASNVLYTVTGTNTYGFQSTASIRITVVAAQTITYTGPNSYTVGTAITALTPGGTGPTLTGASSSPTLPAGLTINAAGVISGTPTTPTATTTYTITATTNNGGTASASIIITVNSVVAPNLTYTTTNVYQSGVAFTLTPTNSGNVATGSLISPTLPAGVSISATGVITGTAATTASPQTSYAVTPSNTGGTGAANAFTIQIADGPAFTYASPDVYTVGTAVTLPPSITAGNPTNFAVTTGTLPAGLTISATTGVISGTPTIAKAAANYTVTATNSFGFINTFVINIKVASAPAFSYPNPSPYIIGTTITALSPTITANGPLSNATISPSLPAGLTISPTGVISGTPTALSPAIIYTVTATGNGTPTTTNSGGVATATVTISVINDNPAALTYTTTNVYQSGVAFTLTPTNSGGVATSSLISPTLPAGISISATGVITGTTATTASPQTSYTVTPSNSGGTGSANTFTIQIADAPVLSYNSPNIFTVGTAVNLTPVITTGGPTNFAVTTGTLPAGLFISATTGVISGTPSATSANFTYTVTATNVYGFIGKATVAIRVSSPPAFSYTDPAPYYVNSAITPLSPAITANGPLSNASISPALPTGLVISTSGVISGTPTVLSAATLYTVTATGNGGGTGTGGISTATVTISVVPPPPPALSYNPNYYSFALGTAVSLSVDNAGGPVASYSISPAALPAGLTFNTTTGVISGTVTTTTAPTSFTVTGTNVSGSSSTVVTISVNGQPPVIAYDPSTYTVSVGVAIPNSIIPTNSGAAVGSGFGYRVPGVQVLTTASSPAPVNNPYGMDVDAAGNVYVINYGAGVTGAGSISVYKTDGTTATFGTGVSLTAPLGIVFDSTGLAYVLTASNIYVYNASGVYQSAITFTGIANATGIAIDGSDNIYVTNSTARTVVKFLKTGGSGVTIVNAAAGYRMTGGLAIDGAGNIYVADSNNDYVEIYDQFGNFLRSISVGTNVFSVSVDGAANVYIAGTTKTYVYNSSGTLLTSITGFNSTRGNTTDASGNLYVSDFAANTVIKYTPVSGYFLTGSLAAGLTFNSTTGQFSGAPTNNFNTTYTVTAYNNAGSGSTTITFNCNSPLPAINYNPNSYVFAQNVTIPVITPNSTGSAITSSSTGVVGYYVPNQIFNTSTTPVANGPVGMAVDPNGLVYVANKTNNTITKFDPVTNITSVFVSAVAGTGGPNSLVFDSSGNAYVLTTTGIYVYNQAGNLQSTAFTGITGGLGIAIDRNNVLYVSSSATNSVTTYLTTGGGSTATVASGYTVSGGVAVDGSGKVYVADGNSYDIFSGGVRQTSINMNSKVYQIYIDGSNNLYIAANTAAYFQNSTGGSSTTFYYFTNSAYSSARGTIVDKYGNYYVADFNANAVYQYQPYSGYFLTGPPLPAGLSFNNTTGQFTGTPTTTFAPITYTVTAWNTIGDGSTTITLSCLIPNNWVSTSSTDWNTGANWSTGTVPAATDNAYIGATAGASYSYSVLPIIPVGTTINIGSIIMGTQNTLPTVATAVTPGVIVNGTLNTSTTITYQGDASSATASVAKLSGTGVINTGNITINANTTTGVAYNETITSSVATLVINNSITLNTVVAGGRNHNAIFNIAGGIVTLNGIVSTTNGAAANTSTLNVAAVSPASTATFKVTSPTFLSGLTATGTNIMSFKNAGTTIEYAGTAAQTIYTDLAIKGLTTGPSYQSLTFSGSNVKTPNGTATNNLNVAGDFTNNLTNDAAASVILNNTVVNFNGTGQTLAGGPGSTAALPTAPGKGTIFKNVNFSGAGTKNISSGVFHVGSTGLLTMTGTSSTILSIASTGNLTLNSDLLGSATVTSLLSGAVISGNTDVQRYISGGSATYRGYRLLSSPVNAGGGNISFNYIAKSSYLTATAGPINGFDGGYNPSLYLFRENLVPSNSSFTSGNFRGINNLSTAPAYGIDVDGAGFNIPQGNGILFFFRGDRNVATYAAETTTSYVPTATTLTATGPLNQGTIGVKTWYTPGSSTGLLYSTTSATTTVEGFNLVGNPYPSSIDWDLFQTSTSGTKIYGQNVGTFIYTLDPVSKNYNVYKSGNGGAANIASAYGNIIPSGQGFFVIASVNGATLQFNEDAKSNVQVSNGNRNLFLGPPLVTAIVPQMHMMLLKDTVALDGIFLDFNNSAKEEYALGEDAPYKLGFGRAGLASRSSDNITLTYNTMPLPKQTKVIPLNVSSGTDGTYQFKMKEMQNIPDVYDVWLKDAYRKDSLDVKHNPLYNFDVLLSDTNSYGANRFSIVMRQNPLLALQLLDFAGSKIPTGTQIVWKTEHEQNYTNFTVERSVDNGTSFQVIGGFASTSAGSYSFIDKAPVTTSNDQYRLKLEDLNGNITYSNIVIIQYAPNSDNIARNGMTIYPNPAISTINISINQTIPNPSYQIQLVNNLGTVVKTATSTNTAWQDDVSRLVPGTYIIKVINNVNKTEVGKGTFVKL